MTAGGARECKVVEMQIGEVDDALALLKELEGLPGGGTAAPSRQGAALSEAEERQRAQAHRLSVTAAMNAAMDGLLRV